MVPGLWKTKPAHEARPHDVILTYPDGLLEIRDEVTEKDGFIYLRFYNSPAIHTIQRDKMLQYIEPS